MYTEVGIASKDEMMQYHEILARATWTEYRADDRHWCKAMVTEPLLGFPGYVNAFFVKLPAVSGHLHRHHDRDLSRPFPIQSFNVVISNNDQCISAWYPESGVEMSRCLERGKVYLTDRDVAHASMNFGATDRIHLLVEMPA